MNDHIDHQAQRAALAARRAESQAIIDAARGARKSRTPSAIDAAREVHLTGQTERRAARAEAQDAATAERNAEGRAMYEQMQRLNPAWAAGIEAAQATAQAERDRLRRHHRAMLGWSDDHE
ncbi:hypothetical protein GCM10023094_32120 [Rhodococcus olei]|uniref:Uncharacterized protein n=1 Tax=Rhodococcus olei TaxID=2161675 RepID=A0ABP8P8W2_9NOCA